MIVLRYFAILLSHLWDLLSVEITVVVKNPCYYFPLELSVLRSSKSKILVLKMSIRSRYELFTFFVTKDFIEDIWGNFCVKKSSWHVLKIEFLKLWALLYIACFRYSARIPGSTAWAKWGLIVKIMDKQYWVTDADKNDRAEGRGTRTCDIPHDVPFRPSHKFISWYGNSTIDQRLKLSSCSHWFCYILCWTKSVEDNTAPVSLKCITNKNHKTVHSQYYCDEFMKS